MADFIANAPSRINHLAIPSILNADFQFRTTLIASFYFSIGMTRLDTKFVYANNCKRGRLGVLP